MNKWIQDQWRSEEIMEKLSTRSDLGKADKPNEWMNRGSTNEWGNYQSYKCMSRED